jgi:hypothetical protein
MAKLLRDAARVELEVRRERLRLELRLCEAELRSVEAELRRTMLCGCRMLCGLRVSVLGCLVGMSD